jgi:hypothetical protein
MVLVWHGLSTCCANDCKGNFMEQDTYQASVGLLSQPAKPRFCEVCQLHHLDYQAMQAIADKARVPKQVADAMSVSVAVPRGQAEKILLALSEHTNQTYTLDNVKVALLPTFAAFHSIHQFDLPVLSTASGVSFDVIGMMLRCEAVATKEARLVLKAASMQAGQKYTVDNVDVRLVEER